MGKNKSKSSAISKNITVDSKAVQHKTFNASKNIVHAHSPEGFDTRQPAWRFSKAAKPDNKWAVYQIDGNNIKISHDLINKLSLFEKMTWADIKKSSKHSSHYIPIQNLAKEAQAELRKLNFWEYEQYIFSLRLNGTQRIWGFLYEGILDIIWYDPNHEICPSYKKHT